MVLMTGGILFALRPRHEAALGLSGASVVAIAMLLLIACEPAAPAETRSDAPR